MDLTTPGYRELHGLFAMACDADLWGTTMGFLFATADVLFHDEPDSIPAAWQYRHSPVCDKPADDSWPDAELADLMASSVVTRDDLIAFGTVLDRYADVLRRPRA